MKARNLRGSQQSAYLLVVERDRWCIEDHLICHARVAHERTLHACYLAGMPLESPPMSTKPEIENAAWPFECTRAEPLEVVQGVVPLAIPATVFESPGPVMTRQGYSKTQHFLGYSLPSRNCRPRRKQLQRAREAPLLQVLFSCESPFCEVSPSIPPWVKSCVEACRKRMRGKRRGAHGLVSRIRR